jgi:hypothetical protein
MVRQRRRIPWRAALLAALALLWVYARYVEPAWMRVRTVEIPIAGLPSALDGLRLAYLSDLHAGETPRSTIARAIRLANGLQADLVVLGGDYVRGKAAAVEDVAPLLATLRAPLGVYAVLGNHDHWTDPALIRRSLEGAGIRLLVNEGALVDVGGGALYLAGLDDGWAGAANLDRALRGAPAGAPLILAAHEPDLIDSLAPQANALGRPIALMLAAHSHGGQVRLPFIGAPFLPYLGEVYDRGLYDVRGTRLYTTVGVGLAGVPVRLLCRPEVVEITLRSGG